MRVTLLSIGLILWLGAWAAAAEQAKPPTEPPAAKVSAPKKADKGSSKAKPAAGKDAAVSDEKVAEQLKVFCVKWMGFLETRERDNRKGIKWETAPSRVAGHFVGYSKDYDCVLKERSSNGTPVATILYKEFVYEKAGASRSEAEQAEPNVVDATEVTEIFRYSKGEWVY
jgi:hypothetical protein